MIDPKKITPLLSNMTVDRKLAKGPSGDVYVVSRRVDGKKLALKHISIPTSDAETKALTYKGIIPGQKAAGRKVTFRVRAITAYDVVTYSDPRSYTIPDGEGDEKTEQPN